MNIENSSNQWVKRLAGVTVISVVVICCLAGTVFAQEREPVSRNTFMVFGNTYIKTLLDGRHVKVVPTENNVDDKEDDYQIFKENEGFVVVDTYIDRSLNKSFKIIIDRSAGICSVETL